MKKTVIILSLFAFIAGSCGQATKKQVERDDNIPYSILGLDSVVFDDETVSKYENCFEQIFINYGNGKSGYKIDSIPIGNDMYSLIVSDMFIDNQNNFIGFSQVWLVNFSAENKYIDSRLIYRREILGEQKIFDTNSKTIYSKLYLPQKKLVIFDNDNYSDEYFEIPVIIHKNGTFEEFPDLPFSKNTVAGSGCTTTGFLGKFPLKQHWTALSLYHNKIETVETERIGYDDFGNECTYFPEIKDFYFDIAFKGVYAPKDFEKMKMKQEDNAEIAEIVKQNLPQAIDTLQSEAIKMNLFSFAHNEKTFWIVYYTFKKKNIENHDDEYTALLGVTPEMEVVLLTNYCIDEGNTFIFRLKEQFFLYVCESSCSEGALSFSHLYKIDNDFKLVFEEDIACD